MKIGITNVFYATPKGHSYVNRDIIKILMDAGHEVHVNRFYNNDLSHEFIKPTSMKSNKDHAITKEDFIKWLDEVKPDVVFFMEYNQWWQDEHNKIIICKDRGIKTIGFLVWEKLDYFNMAQYAEYDKIICPTGFQTKLMRNKGLYNVYHTPWGIDFSEIDGIKPMENREKKKLTFFHCAGSGGVGDRKNTNAIVEAYNKIKDENTELMITHLGQQVFLHDDIIRLTKHADVLVNTSRWDSIGLNTLEANVCGKPVLVCDASPMNEIIKNNINGLLVKCNILDRVKDVSCPSAEVDVDDLAKKMDMLKNDLILKTLQSNSRQFAEINFNWNKNKNAILKAFEE